MKSRIFLTALLAFGPIGLARAAGDQPAGPPAPAPEMAQLTPLKGTTHCTGKQSASQFGPEHATTATVRGRSDLDGFFMTVRYDERKTKQNPMPFHALYQIGYDSAAKQFVLTEFDNFGGHATQTATGWDGDKLTFTGEYAVAGGKLGARDTFTKSGDAVTDHVGEIQGSDGKWTTLDEETCKVRARAVR